MLATVNKVAANMDMPVHMLFLDRAAAAAASALCPSPVLSAMAVSCEMVIKVTKYL